MRISKSHILLVSIILLSFKTLAQKKRVCGFKHFPNQQAELELERVLSSHISRAKKSEVVYSIPVVVHVIHNNSSETTGGINNSNISDEQVLSQIEVLNEDFRRNHSDTTNTPSVFLDVAADVGFEFCIASFDPDGQPTTGITRHYSDDLPFDSRNSLQNRRLKNYGYWPADQYLNIWVTELDDDVLGYATFPSDIDLEGLENYTTDLTNDGIVIDHRVFGRNIGTSQFGNYNLGRTTTHEVGHWFGLYHIWGDQNNCTASDYCDDTPSQFESTTGCPTDQGSCTNRDMYENFMDYSYDACMNIFTIDQKNRMRTVMELSPRRKSLLSSTGCCSVTANSTYPFHSKDENMTNDEWLTSSNGSLISNTISFSISDDSTYFSTPYFNLSELSSPIVIIEGSNDFVGEVYYQLPCDDKWVKHADFSASDQTVQISLSNIRNLSAVKFKLIIQNQDLSISNFSIIDNSSDEGFVAYPNPNNGSFNILFQHQGVQRHYIEIFDTFGNLVGVSDFGNNYSVIESLTTTLPDGIYIIKVHLNDNTFQEKITVTK